MAYADTKSVPIADLHPSLARADDSTVEGTVTVIWPFSSSNKFASLLLVEPDFRLRARRGQVRLDFHGSSAKFVSKAKIAVSDRLSLSLTGVNWAKDESAAFTPGRGIEWKLEYEEYLDLKASPSDGIYKESGETIPLFVDHPSPSSRAVSQDSSAPRSPVPEQDVLPAIRKSHVELLNDQNAWTSPAILKRAHVSTSSYHPFFSDEDFPDNGRHKKLRFGRSSAAWRFAERTPSPVKEPVDVTMIDDTPSRPMTELNTPAISYLPEPEPGSLQITSEEPSAALEDQEMVEHEPLLEIEDSQRPVGRQIEPEEKAVHPAVDQDEEGSSHPAVVQSPKTDEAVADITMLPQGSTDGGEPTKADSPAPEPTRGDQIISPSPAVSAGSSPAPSASRRQSESGDGPAEFHLEHETTTLPFDEMPVEETALSYMSKHNTRLSDYQEKSEMAETIQTSEPDSPGTAEETTTNLQGIVEQGEQSIPVSGRPEKNQALEIQDSQDGQRSLPDAAHLPDFLGTFEPEASMFEANLPPENDISMQVITEEEHPFMQSEERREVLFKPELPTEDDTSYERNMDLEFHKPTTEQQHENNISASGKPEEVSRATSISMSDHDPDVVERFEQPANKTSLNVTQTISKEPDRTLAKGLQEAEDFMNDQIALIDKNDQATHEEDVQSSKSDAEDNVPGEASNHHLSKDPLVLEPEERGEDRERDLDNLPKRLADTFIEPPATIPNSVLPSSKSHLLTPSTTQRTSFRSEASTISLYTQPEDDTLPTPNLTQTAPADVAPSISELIVESPSKAADAAADTFEDAKAQSEIASEKPPSSPPPFSPITPLKKKSKWVDKVKGFRKSSLGTPKSMRSSSAAVASPYFAPRHSVHTVPDSDASVAPSEPEEEIHSVTPKASRVVPATPEKSLGKTFIRSSPPGEIDTPKSSTSSQYVPPSQPAFGGLRTKHSYYVPLKDMGHHFGTHTDVIALALDSSSITRAPAGPKDYTQSIYLTDWSSSEMKHPVATAQIFRPKRLALPQIEQGDIVLLRDFKVQSFRHQLSLISTDTSAWAVFRQGEEVQINGPAIEYGPEERGLVTGLRRWWHEIPESQNDRIFAAVRRERSTASAQPDKGKSDSAAPEVAPGLDTEAENSKTQIQVEKQSLRSASTENPPSREDTVTRSKTMAAEEGSAALVKSENGKGKSRAKPIKKEGINGIGVELPGSQQSNTTNKSNGNGSGWKNRGKKVDPYSTQGLAKELVGNLIDEEESEEDDAATTRRKGRRARTTRSKRVGSSERDDVTTRTRPKRTGRNAESAVDGTIKGSWRKKQ